MKFIVTYATGMHSWLRKIISDIYILNLGICHPDTLTTFKVSKAVRNVELFF
jgi:hypothetical protein